MVHMRLDLFCTSFVGSLTGDNGQWLHCESSVKHKNVTDTTIQSTKLQVMATYLCLVLGSWTVLCISLRKWTKKSGVVAVSFSPLEYIYNIWVRTNREMFVKKQNEKNKNQTGKCPTNKQTPNLNKSNSYSGSAFLDLFLLLNFSILLPELMHPSFCKWTQTFNSRGWKLQIAVPASENRTDAVSSHSQAGLLSPAAPFQLCQQPEPNVDVNPLGAAALTGKQMVKIPALGLVATNTSLKIRNSVLKKHIKTFLYFFSTRKTNVFCDSSIF